ncbi:MAG: restriction endonuclease subunit S [Paracoccaceae bacterium]|uniref:restriction endonuclease subunit S n=1 Tax=Paracoccaceae TaxID=31989 RepID=UPI0032974AEB
MSSATYRETKSAYAPWIDEIPVNWTETRLRFCADVSNSNVDKKEHEGQLAVRLCNYTDVYYNERITPDLDFMVATASKAEIKEFGLRQNDVIITKDSEDPFDIGIPTIVDRDMPNVVCGYHLSVIRANGTVLANFLRYSLMSAVNKAHMYVQTPGITRFGLNQNTIKNILVFAPPPDEQAAIAGYLDRETARIDGLIEKKTRFIALLKEKRAAAITHAVTTGIDGKVAMKLSGHDWLGNIPAHWDVVPPTVLFTESKERAREGDQMLSATQKYGVIPLKEFEALEQRQVTMAVVHLDKRKHVELGDFVISMRSMDGGLERARAVGNVRSSYSVLKCGPDVEARFYGYLLKCSLYIQALRLTSSFIRDGQDMNFGHFRKVSLPRLPLAEQKAIADHLDAMTARIDALMTKTDRSIALLREKRAALITAAVTGKIDVRSAA